MQVTPLQVQRSLEALIDPSAPPAGLRVVETATSRPLPDGLLEQLAGSPSIRSDRMAAARRRLESGPQPTADDLAQRMVGRLVCDRLR